MAAADFRLKTHGNTEGVGARVLQNRPQIPQITSKLGVGGGVDFQGRLIDLSSGVARAISSFLRCDLIPSFCSQLFRDESPSFAKKWAELDLDCVWRCRATFQRCSGGTQHHRGDLTLSRC